MFRQKQLWISAVAVFSLVGCQQAPHRCSNCDRGYAQESYGEPIRETDNSAPPLPNHAPRIPGVSGASRLPRIALPRFSGSDGPSLLARMRSGLSRLNPFSSDRTDTQSYPVYEGNTPLHPIPNNVLPRTATHGSATGGYVPDLGNPRTTWNAPVQRTNTNFRTRTMADSVEDWPRGAVPRQSADRDSIDGNRFPTAGYQSARFAPSLPETPRQKAVPVTQPQRLPQQAAGPIIVPPNAYRSYRNSGLGPISHSRVRNFQ